jgi:hypothetical protein
MNGIHWLVLVTLLVPNAKVWAEDSSGQNSEPFLGVEDWFDGCANLGQETVMTVPKMTLDADCVTLALSYCTQKHTNSYREICHEILTEHLDRKSAEILHLLPMKPNLKGFKRSSYQNALRRASETPQTQCLADMSESDCKLVDATMKWLDLRFANRLLEVD